MKTTYNKSEIMKEAHYWKMILKLSMSEALKMAWRNAKTVIKQAQERIVKAQQYDIMYKERAKNTTSVNMDYLANTLNEYYGNGNGRYKGD